MLRAERLVKNQILRRAANERIADVASRFDAVYQPAVYKFLCECGDRRCRGLLSLSAADYDLARTDAVSFVVALGHQIASIEETVFEDSDHLIVAKFHPEPIKLALAADPRRLSLVQPG